MVGLVMADGQRWAKGGSVVDSETVASEGTGCNPRTRQGV